MSLHSLPELNDKTRVFRDRDEAARRLADMLAAYRGSDALLLGIPTRGLPVAAVMAQALGLPFDVAVVSRICFPWNPEAGFGAVAYDGTVRLHQGLIFDMGLVEPDISRGRDRTLKKVQEWVRLFRGERPFPDLTGRSVILVDEGVSSSLTMSTAVEAVRKTGCGKIVVATVTGYQRSLERLADQVDEVYCANLRGGWGFAVADAFEVWREVSEGEAAEIMQQAVSLGN